MSDLPPDARQCPYCKGVGETRRHGPNGQMRGGYCSHCNGSGIVRCEHEWVTESVQTRAAASPSQRHDPSPEYEQSDVVCKHCGVSREDVT